MDYAGAFASLCALSVIIFCVLGSMLRIRPLSFAWAEIPATLAIMAAQLFAAGWVVALAAKATP